ncbi:hypothetical protein C2845_PM14G19860 [Panicum miliaceum]|uniref:Uncharacterized protein n=1 Tax=Panicum miliaceum TaxID=4540 RepID=A0A3L6PQF8_PANMI|nr:hypothetical protein C2845_PM14G19860 [Panicum miliaceum]
MAGDGLTFAGRRRWVPFSVQHSIYLRGWCLCLTQLPTSKGTLTLAVLASGPPSASSPPGPGAAGAERMASAASAPVFEMVAGIRAIAESGRFKASSFPTSQEQAWFLDQFGILHDGKKPYPGAILALEKLAGNGAKMVIISNSSRRSSVTMDKLKSVGFDTSCFLATITSGELTHQHLLKRNDPWFAALGRKCIHITWGNRGAISLEGLGLQVVNNVDDAEFILAHGTEALGSPSGDPLPKSLEELEQVLMLGLERRLPMVVANPDYVTVEARDLRVMPGTLAAKYENLGGEVKWMGKPDEHPRPALSPRPKRTASAAAPWVEAMNQLTHEKLGESATAAASCCCLSLARRAAAASCCGARTWRGGGSQCGIAQSSSGTSLHDICAQIELRFRPTAVAPHPSAQVQALKQRSQPPHARSCSDGRQRRYSLGQASDELRPRRQRNSSNSSDKQQRTPTSMSSDTHLISRP